MCDVVNEMKWPVAVVSESEVSRLAAAAVTGVSVIRDSTITLPVTSSTDGDNLVHMTDGYREEAVSSSCTVCGYQQDRELKQHKNKDRKKRKRKRDN